MPGYVPLTTRLGPAALVRETVGDRSPTVSRSHLELAIGSGRLGFC
jgi:hypothetical protein